MRALLTVALPLALLSCATAQPKPSSEGSAPASSPANEAGPADSAGAGT